MLYRLSQGQSFYGNPANWVTTLSLGVIQKLLDESLLPALKAVEDGLAKLKETVKCGGRGWMGRPFIATSKGPLATYFTCSVWHATQCSKQTFVVCLEYAWHTAMHNVPFACALLIGKQLHPDTGLDPALWQTAMLIAASACRALASSSVHHCKLLLLAS